MNENLFEAQYDISKKSKLKKFYDKNKIFIYSIIFILIVVFCTSIYYFSNKEKKKILLSENYIKAKIYLENGKKEDALNILKDVIYAEDPIYSTLSLFLILNQDLITNQKEISSLFNFIIDNNKFEKEIRNLLLYKKSLLNSNFLSEQKLLLEMKPLLNNNSYWKPHALLLLGDYFMSKQEFLKAKDFYLQILSIKKLNKDLYDEAKNRLLNINND